MRACCPDTSPSSSTATLACTGSPSARRPRYSSSPTICSRPRADSPGTTALPDISSTARSRCSPGESGDCTDVSVWSRVSPIAVDSSTGGPRRRRLPPFTSLAGDAGELGRRRDQRRAVAQLAGRCRRPSTRRVPSPRRAQVCAPPAASASHVGRGPRRGPACRCRRCRRCPAGRARSRPSTDARRSAAMAQVCARAGDDRERAFDAGDRRRDPAASVLPARRQLAVGAAPPAQHLAAGDQRAGVRARPRRSPSRVTPRPARP